MDEVDSAAAVVLLKKGGVPVNESRAIVLGSINNLSHKEYAIKKCTVGIDAHKESNGRGAFFDDMQPLILPMLRVRFTEKRRWGRRTPKWLRRAGSDLDCGDPVSALEPCRTESCTGDGDDARQSEDDIRRWNV